MGGRRVGIKDVAAAAGVSATTVSHVLNDVDGTRINSDTRARVREAARRLGYVPNSLARGLRLQRSQTIGLISDEIATTPFAGRIILGAQDAVTAHDGVLVVMNSGGDVALERREARVLRQRQVEGVLHAAMYHRAVAVPPELTGLPVVLLNAVSADPGVSSVVPDEVGGGQDAATLLLRAGHRRIGVVNSVDDIPAVPARLAGFREVARTGGLGTFPVAADRPTTAGGHRAALALLDRADRPTGLFCFNDQMAWGAYRAAAELGLRIPHDLSVVGFDNLELIADSLSPGLTTIALPHYEMGVWAAEHLYRIIDAAADAPPVVRTTLRGPVVDRGSVAPPPISGGRSRRRGGG